MKHLSSHSKTSLFLMEMILSLLFLSLAACVCVQIFVSAKSAREQAREWNHIQELTVSVGEFLEGSKGTPEEFLSLYPMGQQQENHLSYYFDSSWNLLSHKELSSDAVEHSSYQYCMKLTFLSEKREKKVLLHFYKKEQELYQQEISFPLFSLRKEAASL